MYNLLLFILCKKYLLMFFIDANTSTAPNGNYLYFLNDHYVIVLSND